MKVKGTVLYNSSIYSILNLLQKGINFLLIPILTLYLTPQDYGIVAVVAALNAFLYKIYLLSLNASVNRFYYEYKEDELKVRKLFGTTVTFVFLTSVVLTIILLFGHNFLIDPFLGGVSFFPYMLLGMISVLFNPVFMIYQNTLQAKQEGIKYARQNLMFFIVNLIFLLVSVVIFELGAQGVIGALALTNFIFFLYTLTKFSKEIKFGIDFVILRDSLKYSLPLVPHSISAVASTFIDRIFINNFLSTSLVGIYSLGNNFGGIIALISSGVNQAFVPWFNERVKSGTIQTIPKVTKILVMFYCLTALGISLFGKDVIISLTPSNYHSSWVVIPIISFSCVYHSVYYFFSVPLFYNIKKKGSSVLPIYTIMAAIINIGLNFILIMKFKIIGAAIASFLTEFMLVMALSMVYKKFVKINYPHLIMIWAP